MLSRIVALRRSLADSTGGSGGGEGEDKVYPLKLIIMSATLRCVHVHRHFHYVCCYVCICCSMPQGLQPFSSPGQPFGPGCSISVWPCLPSSALQSLTVIPLHLSLLTLPCPLVHFARCHLQNGRLCPEQAPVPGAAARGVRARPPVSRHRALQQADGAARLCGGGVQEGARAVGAQRVLH